MRYYITAEQDASIYSEFPTKTTGEDEILEVGKTNNGADAVRSLIQFNLTSVSASIASLQYSSASRFDLKLKIANATTLKRDQLIYFYPLSQSWEEGTGYFYQDRTYEVYGPSWRYRESGSNWNASGSDFVQSVFTTASMSRPVTDLTVDVTDIVRTWLSGTIPNYGMIAMFTSSDESWVANKGNIKFFSKDTHTIHSPMLVVKDPTSTYLTGSLTSSMVLTNPKIQAIDLKDSYDRTDTVLVNLHVRPEYPTKTFGDTLTTFAPRYYLPTSSYFCIVDVQMNSAIDAFDQYSPIQNDGTGSFIQFDARALYPNRRYQLRYRIDYGTRAITSVDNRIFTIRDIPSEIV